MKMDSCCKLMIDHVQFLNSRIDTIGTLHTNVQSRLQLFQNFSSDGDL